MKTWNPTALHGLLLTGPLAFAIGCNPAFADEKRPGPKPYASGAPSASATAMPAEPEVKIIDGHKPWAPTLDVAIPETPSAAPTKEEWASAPQAWEVRITDPGCKAQRVREWYRVDCGFGLSEMISGPREGVTFGCLKTGGPSDFCDDAWVIFPARRGDVRAIQILRWGKWGPDPDAFLTEQFLEGDPCPQISVQGVRWEF